MNIQFKVKINEGLYLRNPEDTELGRKILINSVKLMHKLGFEEFTFKKLADEILSTEAGIYRYFENKHKLLIYLTAWYFNWLEFNIRYVTNNINTPKVKLSKIISMLTAPIEYHDHVGFIDERLLYSLIVAESSKSYLTKQVEQDNKQQFFQPYTDLCVLIGDVILEYNPDYKFPRSLASTIVEVAHFQNYFMQNLSSLTDFNKKNMDGEVKTFLEDLVFSSLDCRN